MLRTRARARVCVCVCIVNLHWVKIFPIYKNPKVWEIEVQV